MINDTVTSNEQASFLDQVVKIHTTTSPDATREIDETMELEMALKNSQLGYVKEEFELAVMEALQVRQLELLSATIAEQEQQYRAELELATQDSEIIEVSRLETKEMLRGFKDNDDVQDHSYRAELELAMQESEMIEVSRLEAEERLNDIKNNLAIDEQDEEYLAELEFVKQESEIIEVSRLEEEERLKEIEEEILAELLALTRVANE